MPTQHWMEKRQLVTFWLLKEEYAEFVRACQESEVSVAEALRRTVLAVLPAKD